MLYFLELVSEIKTIHLDGPKSRGHTGYIVPFGTIGDAIIEVFIWVQVLTRVSIVHQRVLLHTHHTRELNKEFSSSSTDFSKTQQLLLVHCYSGRKQQKMYPLTCEYALASCLKTLSSGDWLYRVSPSLSSSYG